LQAGVSVLFHEKSRRDAGATKMRTGAQNPRARCDGKKFY
jgi:hypothetical protein